MTDRKQLRRVRWGVRAVLLLGVAASVTANVLHAVDNPISQSIAAWPPLALLLTVELISRIPVHSRGLAFARIVATAVIAGIAAWVSYWHMAGVAARYGETGAAPYLLPLSVDGLIVVASICLVELAGRIRSAEEEVSDGEARSEREHTQRRAAVAVQVPADRRQPERQPGGAPGGQTVGQEAGQEAQEVAATEPAQIKPPRKPHTPNPQRVAQAHRKHPDATHAEIADRLNLSRATVKKYRPPVTSEGAPPKVNGHTPVLVGAGPDEREN